MQDHRFSKNRPENIGFLKRMRALTDEYEGRMLVGEVGETPRRAIEIMADYTRGRERLHMAYSFDMLGPEFSAKHFRSRVAKFFKAAPDGWPCWSFSNHDVVRHVSRWEAFGGSPEALARQAAAMLVSLRGSICLYQGEELGLPESELDFAELTDPPGIRFWPEYKGRDGCRTPIPWTGKETYFGFAKAKPWLPIKPPQAALNVAGQAGAADSTLAFYRDLLAWRRTRPALVRGEISFVKTDEPVLAFVRQHGRDAVTCVFNLSPEPVDVKMRGLAFATGAPVQVAVEGHRLRLGSNGFAFLTPETTPGAARIRYGR
jgi:alpha-glucosidase